MIKIAYILLKSFHRLFDELFFLFWHKIWCIVQKKFKSFDKKNANHTIFSYGNCITRIFLMTTTKIFQNNFESALKSFLVFF